MRSPTFQISGTGEISGYPEIRLPGNANKSKLDGLAGRTKIVMFLSKALRQVSQTVRKLTPMSMLGCVLTHKNIHSFALARC